MSPDSTAFIDNLLNPNQWALKDIIAIILAFAALVLTWLYRPTRQQRRTQRLLEKSFGSELYGPEVIERSTRYYIPPNCSSVDPAQEAEMRQVVTTEEKLFEAVDKHLAKDNPHRHLLLLADSGMGKTAFALNYYARNQRLPKRKRQRLAVVPLGIPDADEYIAKVTDQQNTVIFLDAFDEDTKAIKDHRQRLMELMHACRNFRRVLITCRTQFFPKDEEIPRDTGIARVGPRKAGEKGVYEFWKLYLSPLSDEQVDAFLRRRYPYWPWGKRKRARELVRKIPLLSVRPMLLSYIPEVLESGAQIDYSFQLYEVMVEKWLERESRWVNPEALRNFSEGLAVDIYINRQRRGAERIPRTELSVLANQWQIPLDEWQVSGRSLLNRDAEGNYKFAHRSILEYLFVKRFTLGDGNCCGMTWTDQMIAFLTDMVQSNIVARQPLPFSTKGADLPGFLLDLRSTPVDNLSDKMVRAMLEQRDFFDKDWNIEGKGVQHLYAEMMSAGDRVVIDYATGLMWQQDGSSSTMKHAEAETYIQDLNRKKFAGYDDWRLPTLEEAMSLMESTKKNGNLHIDSVFDKTHERIWTVDKSDADMAWALHCVKDGCRKYDVLDSIYVRAVR